MNRGFFFRLVLILSLLRVGVQSSLAADAPGGGAILQDMRSFSTLGSVLFVAAHPDDENTQLITYLARGRGYRMAYLSLTRGDGGQNLLGPEFGDELGVIRTQELLAARRLDGGRQYFTRAKDFGYSKDYRQTLTKWDHQEVVSDIVRIIREFRPDVVITRFSTVPSNTHGHHTASAILALEAYKVADDPKVLPELAPWKPKRIFMNGLGTGFRRADQLVPGANNKVDNVRIDIGGNDPVLGVPFGQIASRSRAMHKTQGFGNFGGGPGGGGGGGGGPRYETFQLLDGEAATGDILDGIDTTWNRFAGGAEIAKQTGELIAQFNPQNPSASVPALLKIRSLVAELPSDPVVDDKRRQLDGILQHCLGLEVRTTVAAAEVVPGEELKLHHAAVVHSDVPVRWVGVHYPVTAQDGGTAVALQPNESAACDVAQTLPQNTPISQKYWLREEGTAGMFRVDDPALIGRPENLPAFPVEWVFEVGGQKVVIPDEPVTQAHRRLDVIPPVALHLPSDVVLFAPGTSRAVQVEVTAYRAGAAGTLQLDAPAGWTVSPATLPLQLANLNDHAAFNFTVTAPSSPQSADITAVATIGGNRYSTQRVEISYDHIPVQLLQPPARVKAVCLELAIRGHNVAYLPGAGDSVADSLTQMGYAVTEITGADLTPEKLRGFDAVVIGVRAFNVRKDLQAHLPALWAYVESGGNVIEQYNRPDGLQDARLGPYDLTLARDLPKYRVTDENAPVTLLAPDHPAFNTPNKITAADFDGWVQERGLVFPATWDTDHYTPLLACSDAGEAPLKSAILVARYGKGYFVYTGLSWFRQLPAGVPGAIRLFANLVSLGK